MDSNAKRMIEWSGVAFSKETDEENFRGFSVAAQSEIEAKSIVESRFPGFVVIDIYEDYACTASYTESIKTAAKESRL